MSNRKPASASCEHRREGVPPGGGVVDELVARIDTASPALALGVKAELVRFGGIDSFKPDFHPADLDRVTVDNAGGAGQFGGGGRADDREPK